MTPSNIFFLLAVDTVGIQKYIFNSNRLRENIGASHLVASITGYWAFDAVRQAAGKLDGAHNVDDDDKLNDVTIDQPTTAAEVLYSGGGNFVVLFRSKDMAKAFTQVLSRRVLKEAPGLHLMIHSVPFDWGKDVLQEKLKQLFREMKERRSTQPNVMPIAGLGVTVMCHSTALPAVGTDSETRNDPESRPVSAEVLAKLGAVDNATRRLSEELPPSEGHRYPLDLDDLGRTRGEASLIAVVHADGDGIGKKFETIGNEYKSSHPGEVREHINKLRWFSRRLAEAARAAQIGTVDYLWQLARDSEDVAELFSKRYVPFRPLVFGGDDVTFVSDGRIGLALTLEYLRRFQHETERLLGERLTACAGVAIVKSHYPFARAYELAEDLCKNAKNYRRKCAPDACCLDWHFTTGGIYGDLEAIRQREYTVAADSLTLRPVTTSGDRMRSWGTIAAGLAAFQSDDWRQKRNKAKALREKLRGGQAAVEEFEKLYGQNLPKVNDFDHGWGKGYCGYFDALELMDLYLPLLQENANEPHPAS